MAFLSDLLAKILTSKSRVKKAWKAPKKGLGGPRDKQSELSRGISGQKKGRWTKGWTNGAKFNPVHKSRLRFSDGRGRPITRHQWRENCQLF